MEEVQYPVVVLRAPLREDDEGDTFVPGSFDGGIYHRPSQWPVGRAVNRLGQPGRLAAQLGCYYDSGCGFYSATQDSRGYPKELRFQRTKSGLEYAWQRHCYHDMSKRFDLGYAVAQATFRSPDPDAATDWRDAAEIYKTWALKQPWCARTLAERDDLPGWLKEGPAMVRFRRRHTYYEPNVRLEHHPDRYSHPEHIEGWLKGYWQQHFPDVPLIVAFWGWEQVASWVSPKYFPPYPSEEGLRRRVKAVRDVGGHPFFWPSGYQWAVTFGERQDGRFEWDDREDFEKVGRPHAVITRGGLPFARTDFWLRGGTNCMLCRGDAWTRRWLNETTVELTKRGADLIQVDQVVFGCGPGERGACYSQRHGHAAGPGPWFTEAFAEQLRTMLEASRRLQPDTFLGFEGAQEFYLQQIGIQDYRDFEVYWKPGAWGRTPASVFGYLYHEFVPLFQSNPEGFRGKPPGGNMLMMAYCLVNGQMPHLVSHWPLQPSPAFQNGDFEHWNENLPDGWTRIKADSSQESSGLPYCDERIKHSGKFSLRLENRNSDDVVDVSQEIGIGGYELEVGGHGPEVGKTYRLSLWFKADEIREPSRVSLEAFDAEGGATGTWSIPLTRCDDWQRGEVGFTVPEHTERAQVVLQAAGVCKVWFDDVLLEEPGEDGTYRVVMNKPILAAEHDLGLRWVRLFHDEGRPYLLLGRMLRPPQLITGKVKCPPMPLAGVRVPLHISDSKGEIIQTAPINIVRDTNWVRRETTFAIPEAAQRATLYLHFTVKGNFWFDDIRLTEVGSEETLLRNGDFEDWQDASAAPAGWTAPNRWGKVECTGRFYRDEKERRNGKFGVSLVNEKEGDVIQLSQSLPVDGKTLCKGKTYRLSLCMKVQGAGSVERELPAILHNAYRAPDGREAVIAVNITDEPQSGKLRWGGKEIDLRLSPWEARLIRK